MDTNEKKWCVYIHTNKINNKVYVGITSQSPNRRWRNGRAYKQNTHFRNAINKYGWDNFEHIVFAEDLDYNRACQMEKILIALYNTTNANYGYNKTSGGDAKLIVTDEARKKMSLNHADVSGENNPNYGNHKIAGENNPFYGKKHSEETKQKLRELRLGKSSHNKGVPMTPEMKKVLSERKDKYKKPVIQMDLTGQLIQEFESMRQAYFTTGISVTTIGRCCKGKQKTSGGFKWKFNDEAIKLKLADGYYKED